MSEAFAGSTVIPGFWVRTAARIVDWLLVLVAQGMGILLFIFTATFFRSIRGLSFADVGPAATKNLPVQWVAGVIAPVLYHAMTEGVLGTTPGKRLFGLRVISEGLGRVSLWQALVRNLAFFVDALLFGIVAALAMRGSSTGQRLGDRWARTRVARQRSLEGYPWPPGAVFTFVILGAFFIVVEASAVGEYVLFLWKAR